MAFGQLILIRLFILAGLVAAVKGEEDNDDELRRQCLFSPVWDSSNYDDCKELTGWTPRSEIWSRKFLDERKRPINLYSTDSMLPISEPVLDCVQDGRFAVDTLQGLGLLDNPYAVDDDEDDGEDFDPFDAWSLDKLEVATMHESNEHGVLMVEVKNAIPPHFASSLEVLAACVRMHSYYNNYEHRAFNGGTGNDCTYLANLLQLYLPGLAARIQKVGEFASEAAGWTSNPDLKPIGECGLRTSEHLEYGTFDPDADGLSGHLDSGSIYTVLFALADPDDYGGGEYYIEEENEEGDSEHHKYKPEKYSAVVFLSEITSHGVEKIDWGHREMFTNEFWDLADVPFPHSRPDRFEPRFEAYMKLGGEWPTKEQMYEFCEETYPENEDCTNPANEDDPEFFKNDYWKRIAATQEE